MVEMLVTLVIFGAALSVIGGYGSIVVRKTAGIIDYLLPRMTWANATNEFDAAIADAQRTFVFGGRLEKNSAEWSGGIVSAALPPRDDGTQFLAQEGLQLVVPPAGSSMLTIVTIDRANTAAVWLIQRYEATSGLQYEFAWSRPNGLRGAARFLAANCSNSSEGEDQPPPAAIQQGDVCVISLPNPAFAGGRQVHGTPIQPQFFVRAYRLP